MASPFYLVPSGLPQIADFILIAAALPVAGLLLVTSKHINAVYLTGILFVALTVSINAVHFTFNHDLQYIKSSFYYIYNLLVFVFIAHLFSRDPDTLHNTSALLIYAIALIQLFFIIVFPQDTALRETGTFNNPNQFSYWSLLSVTMLAFLRRKTGFKLTDYIAMSLFGFFQILSLSKAGILSYLLMLAIFFFSPLVTQKSRLFLLCLMIVGGLIMANLPLSKEIYSQIHTSLKIEQAIDRIEDIGSEADDTLSGRGYDRLFKYPVFNILGAGEGGYSHFQNNIHQGEIHSGLATILFSYGILGLFLFLFFLHMVFRGHPWHLILLVVPVLLYGLTHQNVRFTHFWVLLGIVYATRQSGSKNAQSPRLHLLPESGQAKPSAAP